MKIKACLLSLVALLSFSVYALELPTVAIKQAMHSNEQRPFNGVVLIAQDNKTLYEAAYGNYGSPKLADQFIVASISKQITATLILQLVDQGLINLASPINKYLPNLSDSWATQVTVAQLLNHTSGITAIGQPLAFAAGTQFKYSPTITYYLLSQIAQNVTGKTYKELLAKLFKQARMPNSHIATSRILEKLYKNNPRLVRGFQEIEHKIAPTVSLDEGIDVDYGWLHPGGGIITTAADLLNWNQALHVNKSLLSKESYNRMITASSARQHPRYGNIEYGFGVQLLNQDGLHEISHSGYINGYISTLIYYPQSKISLIVLENISWDVTDVKRVFASHDSLRDLVRVTIQQEIAQDLNQQIQTKSLSLTDKTRNRSIPVELYKGSNIVNAKNKTTKRPLVIINHGHNIANSEYKFIAKDLVKRGYVVASIQHQLANDPTLPFKATIIETRKPEWERGCQNILFVMSELAAIEPNLDLQHVTLIGHSGGGDIAMLFADIYPELVAKAISLDSLRYPLPTKNKIPILSLRSNDSQADDGVLPVSGATITSLPNVGHMDMCDRGTEAAKQQIIEQLIKFI